MLHFALIYRVCFRVLVFAGFLFCCSCFFFYLLIRVCLLSFYISLFFLPVVLFDYVIMLGFLLDIERYVCPRAMYGRVCVCVLYGCVGVLHAIFSAAAAVFVVVSLDSWVAIDVSGSSSTFFAHTYTIHGRHTGHCVCACVRACASVCERVSW